MPSDPETVILGAEYDERLRAIVRQVLIELGGKAIGQGWALGGSQELESLEVELEGDRLLVEAETYVGLSITGPSSLVRRVQALVTERQRRPR